MGWTNPEDDKQLEKECSFCGEECENTYCNRECEEADIND